MIKLINRVGATLSLPLTMSWRRVPASWSVPSSRLVHGDGAVLAGKRTLEPRQFELSGPVYDVDPTAIRSTFDTIAAFLQHAPVQVFQHHEDDRFLFAYPLGYPQEWIDGRRELRLRIPMVALDPYFYGHEERHTEQVSSGSRQWMLEIGGTAPTYPKVIITFGVQTEDPRIMHVGTGEVLAFEGTFLPGERLIVDTARFTAVLDDGCTEEQVMDMAHEDWLIRGFRLHPGRNDLLFTASGMAPAADVEMIWRPRYF